MPSGGGAIRGIGEKFTVNPANGTASVSIPLPLSHDRSGHAPQLALGYQSGAGNGIVGVGWQLSVSAVTRKTDNGIPRYGDALAPGHGESPYHDEDVFILAGAEDLVPVLDAPGEQRCAAGHAESTWRRRVTTRTLAGRNYHVAEYRPRIDNLHARIEKWTDTRTREVQWRSISRDNVTSRYGVDANSRLADPENPHRVFSWLLSDTHDDKGNAVRYEYKPEDDAGVDTTATHEHHRAQAARTANRYLKRVRYGNRRSYLTDPQIFDSPARSEDWMFEVVLDYGEHDHASPAPTEGHPWACRLDPFSDHRSGFEIRTYRLCQRVLLFHHLPEDPQVGQDCLVKSTRLRYRGDSARGQTRLSVLVEVKSCGHRRTKDGYRTATLPPLRFDYAQANPDPEVHDLPSDELRRLAVADPSSNWVDLDGTGMPGLLTRARDTWFYTPNRGEGRFGPRRRVGTLPTAATAGPAVAPSASDPRQQLLDLDGDGQLELVEFNGSMPGFYERRDGADVWQRFVPFASRPSIAWDDERMRFIDLTGDGLADILLLGDDVFTWYASEGHQGFRLGGRTYPGFDADRGPRLVGSSAAEAVFLADMSGDGLVDLVRVGAIGVCYWPNRGYGQFGAPVHLSGDSRLDEPDQFDPRRVRLADIDGSGPADLIYLHRDGVRILANHSGNTLVAEPTLPQRFGSPHSMADVQVVDLLGRGTACLVWSSPLPSAAERSLRYVDLIGPTKPHLLVRMDNNLGAVRRLHYTPSTRFSAADAEAGRPWVTRLPFPVHVLHRVELIDQVAKTRFVSRYAYHHGYFDGTEREFRGFGMVEQWDTELIEGLVEDTRGAGAEFVDVEAADDDRYQNEEAASWRPPVLVRTWFHTGAPIGTRPNADDYWVEPHCRPDQPMPAIEGSHLPVLSTEEWTQAEWLEAYRALRGTSLRSESYSLDGTPRADIPQVVTEQCVEVRRRQPRGPNRHAVFGVFPRDSASFQYEHQADDPRVNHEVALEVDDFGNVIRSVSIGYPRRVASLDRDRADRAALPGAFGDMLARDQSRLHAAASLNRFTNALTDSRVTPDVNRTPLPTESVAAELIGMPEPPEVRHGRRFFTRTEVDEVWFSAWAPGRELPYEQLSAEDVRDVGAAPPSGAQPQPMVPHRRVVERVVLRYRSDDLAGLLPVGSLESRAIPGRSYRLALTEGMLTAVLGGRVDEAALREGGYVRLAGESGWWAPSGIVHYSPDPHDTPDRELEQAVEHFFLPRRSVDPFGAVTRVTFDSLDLLPVEALDSVGNVTRSVPDYRVLQPAEILDPNGNRVQAAFDTLGLVVGTAVLGKPGDETGDSLDRFQPDVDDVTLAAHLADPLTDPGALLASATARTCYDVHAFHRSGGTTPATVYTLARENHVGAPTPLGSSRGYRHTFGYCDGLGRQVQQKGQAEPGPVEGESPVGEEGPAGAADAVRWIASGWTLFDNKGTPIVAYEPFFTRTNGFESDRRAGVGTFRFRDATGREVAALHPDQTWEKSVIGAWRHDVWDVNDTVLVDDPRTDPDVGDYFRRHLPGGPFTSWYRQRVAADSDPADADAACKTAQHAGTPSVVHLDSIGRGCLAVATAADGALLPNRTVQDGEGNLLVAIDALGRHAVEHVVRLPDGAVRSGYDVTGKPLCNTALDGGRRWTLPDVAGQPLRSWDERGHAFRHRYDPSRRRTHLYVTTQPDNSTGAGEVLLERSVYGEGLPDRNLCGRLFRVYDSAGLASNEQYDVNGNLARSSRQLPVNHRESTDWAPIAELTDPDALDEAAALLLRPTDRYTAISTYDALSRIVQVVTPHSDDVAPAVIRNRYGIGGLLDAVDAWYEVPGPPRELLDPADATLRALTDLEYNARGQRTLLRLGNGTTTTADYDPRSFRLRRLTTLRPSSGTTLQDLRYTYDPVGNVTRIVDAADLQEVTFFRNQRVEPVSDYTHDAHYRLTDARGREHLGQAGTPAAGPDNAGAMLLGPDDSGTVAAYTERYDYDAAGNLLELVHQVSTGGWRRRYRYAETSPLQPDQVSNRLSSTGVGPDDLPDTERYTHDAHGNMTSMPHLGELRWDEHDHLRATVRQAVTRGLPETTYYAYDTAGQRALKATDAQAEPGATPSVRSERLYLGPVEVYREFDPKGTVRLKRRTLHIGTCQAL